MSAEIIGRDEELAAIEAFLADVDQGPKALVLSGEAGIGKTILWEAGVEQAKERFGRVLTCHGIEAEASFAFAGLSELLAGVVREVAPGLVPPRRHALEVALQLAEPGGMAPDAHVIGLALLDAVQALAEHGPVLVALDDLQWLDPASASVLQIALRRLREEPVGLLGTIRLGPDLESPLELDRMFPEQRLEQFSVGPLSLGAVHSLLEERLGLDLTRPELARVQEATAGNPFFALELGRELVRTNTRPTPGQPLRVPESLRELLGGRLARLPGETLDVLLEAAALARPTIELVAAVQGDQDRVLGALEAAVREGVVELEGSQVRFAHPLLASICYEQAAVWKRRAVHRALAGVVADVEEQARHLALAADGPDAVAASYLDAAAEHAAVRGASFTAGELYELAAQLTPNDPALERQRRLRAAHVHRLGGDHVRATSMLEQLRTEASTGPESADILFELASTLGADHSTSVQLCDEALSEAEGDDVRSARILGLRSWILLFKADVRAAVVDARAALERAERTGDPALVAAAIGQLATAEGRAGEVTPALLERGVEIEQSLSLSLEYHESPRVALSRRLVGLGKLDQARTILEELEEQAATRGKELLRAQIIGSIGRLEWYAGRLERALERVTAAQELGEQMQAVHNFAFTGRLKALALADLGRVDEARVSAEDGLARSEALSDEEWTILILGVLGRLELTLGNLEAAAGYLRDLPERALSQGYTDPTTPFWTDAIETLVGLGERERAREYLEHYEAHAERLSSPWALAAAARCRGLLCAAEGDLEGAFAALERSLAALDGLPFPLERGRTLLSLGVVRRQGQQKKAAREVFDDALEIFEDLGARLWAEKARAELARISGRRAASDELTETEHRVAELAAQGRTNKEIAAELFLGVSTVESHLSHVYRKLGVRRAELGPLLAKQRDEAAQP